MTHAYLQHIESSLASFTWAKSVQVLRCNILETDAEEILVYRFRVSLSDSSLLEMMERVCKGNHVVPGRPINGLEILDEIDRDFFDADEESKK